MQQISDTAISRRKFWIDEIQKIGGNFNEDSNRLEMELEKEIKKNGNIALIEHLRLCGNIPESFGYDTSEEKLYSKYTDILKELIKIHKIDSKIKTIQGISDTGLFSIK